LRTWIVVRALNARVPKFSDSLTSYSADSFRLVALTLPGMRPGFDPVVTPRSSDSAAVSRARRGGFVEPAIGEGAGVGEGAVVAAAAAGGAGDGGRGSAGWRSWTAAAGIARSRIRTTSPSTAGPRRTWRTPRWRRASRPRDSAVIG
jgi:hypothetical protein